jgi:hypothetical protein
MAGGRSAWAAGSGEDSGSGGNEGEFHMVNELVFVGFRHDSHVG